MSASTLDAHLETAASNGSPASGATADIVRALADAAVGISSQIAQASAESLAPAADPQNNDGDGRSTVAIGADESFRFAARTAGVRHYCSVELDSAIDLNGGTALALAIAPLDGSAGIEADVPAGTIFSILPAAEGDAAASFLQPGGNQRCAGFFIYGPRLALALRLGADTRIFIHSARLRSFVETARPAVPERTQAFAIDASNYRHWFEAVRLYVDDCLKGAAGPRDKDFDMHWSGSLAAEAFRVLLRGGVLLSPGDGRKGHAQGRLRLICEANPLAMLIEGAGGAATDGVRRILDIQPNALRQRTPLVFGSAREVARIGRYHTEPSGIAERAPLFGNRGLFRA